MTSRFPTAEELASFPKANYVNPVTRQPLVVGVMITMSILITTFVFCRVYSRSVLVRAIGWDDWIMISAGVVAVVNNILVTLSTSSRYQMGYHIWDIRLTQLLGTLNAGKFGMAIQLLFILSIGLTKVSILMTYLRIFPSKINKWFCAVMLAYTIALNIACFFLVLFQCHPIRVFWETFKFMLSVKERCRNVKAIYFFWSGQNTLSDFLIFLWPIKDIASIRISRRQRITLISMFSCGIIVCVAGSARIYYTHLYLYSYDILWWGATVFTVMSIETGVGIVCGCLPGCKPLMSRMFPRVFGTTTHGSNTRPRNRRAVKEIISSGMSGTIDIIEPSFQMQSLRTGDEGIVVPSSPDGPAQKLYGEGHVRMESLTAPTPALCSSKEEKPWPPLPYRERGGDYGDVIESQQLISPLRHLSRSLDNVDLELGKPRFGQAVYSDQGNKNWI